jgi:hypothetical protein
LLGVCPDLLLKLLKLNIIEVGTKSPCNKPSVPGVLLTALARIAEELERKDQS